MSKLDITKEQIAYLKFWLGVMVVTDISLVGWLISSADSAPMSKVFSAVFAVAIITLAGFKVHNQIECQINSLEEL